MQKGENYNAGSVAEGRRRSPVGFMLMQRPRLTKTRCAAAAAELEWQWGCERKKKTKGERRERMKKDLVWSIYMERPPKEHEKRGAKKHKLSN